MSELVATGTSFTSLHYITSSTFRPLITFRKRQQLSASECLLMVSSDTNFL